MTAFSLACCCFSSSAINNSNSSVTSTCRSRDGCDNAVAVIYSTRRKAATSRPERMKAKFCDFKDSGGRQVTQKLKPLFRTLSTIPCFTAECETGFSCMNVIMNDLRSAVLIDHVSSLLFINIYGPPVYQ